MNYLKQLHISHAGFRYFRRIFFTFLAVTLLPLSAICLCMIYFNTHLARKELSEQNQAILSQMENSVTHCFTEIDSLQMTFSTNYRAIYALERCMENPEKMRYTYYYATNIIQDFLRSPSDYHSYMYSMEVYLNDQSYYLSSLDGLAALPDSITNHWIRTMSVPHMELRTLSDTGLEVLSVYRPIHGLSAGAHPKGVIVSNIKKSYLQACLKKAAVRPGQIVLLMLEEGSLYLSYPSCDFISRLPAEKLLSDTSHTLVLDNVSYYVDMCRHEGGVSFVMLTPSSSASALSGHINHFFLLALFSVLLSSIALALLFTVRQYRQVMTIIDYLASAEEISSPSAPVVPMHDEFAFILQNVINLFVRNRAMKEQINNLSYEHRIMQLVALQAQINPHFLYNTFESINWKLIKQYGHPTEVNDMIADLSDILSYSLETPLSTVALQQEMDITESYLNIVRQRENRTFSFSWRIDPKCLGIHLPRMIFQPLVENAIMHGLQDSPAPCLRICIRPRSTRVRILILDNGVGIASDRLTILNQKLDADNSSPDSKHGIGVFNTSHRLKIIYGPDAGIHIYSKLHMGTCVYFEVPFFEE